VEIVPGSVDCGGSRRTARYARPETVRQLRDSVVRWRAANLILVARICGSGFVGHKGVLNYSKQMGWLVGAVGFGLKARLNPRKLLILRLAKMSKRRQFAQARYTPGTRSSTMERTGTVPETRSLGFSLSEHRHILLVDECASH